MTAAEFHAIVCNISGGSREPVRIRQLVRRGITHNAISAAAALLDADEQILITGSSKSEYSRREKVD